MTKETYEQKMKALEKNFKAEKEKLYLEYMNENAKYKVGDFITDGSNIIKVERIKCTVYHYSTPSIYYVGLEMKKDLTPRAKAMLISISESNAQKIDI